MFIYRMVVPRCNKRIEGAKIDIYEMEKHVKPTSTTIQKIARDVLATQKHDKLYEALNPNQQKEIKGFLV